MKFMKEIDCEEFNREKIKKKKTHLFRFLREIFNYDSD